MQICPRLVYATIIICTGHMLYAAIGRIFQENYTQYIFHKNNLALFYNSLTKFIREYIIIMLCCKIFLYVFFSK